MTEKLKVTLIANAGVLVEYAGTKILLDAIYGSEGHSFSNLSAELWQSMLTGVPPFEKIDYLLFTHTHPDHFSPEMVKEFLMRRAIKGIFLPQSSFSEDGELSSFLQEKQIPAVILQRQMGHAVYHMESNVTVHAISTRHLDKQYVKVEHFCYLIRFDEKQILFTADVDYTTETFAALGDVRLRAVFVNPLFYSALRWKRFFQGVLNTEYICVYHIPFAEDDNMGIRQNLTRNIAAWSSKEAETVVLDERLTQIEIGDCTSQTKME